jgi:hypothetical protein
MREQPQHHNEIGQPAGARRKVTFGVGVKIVVDCAKKELGVLA